MNNSTIFIIETILALFICWNLRIKIKNIIIDSIRQIQLRNYLAGNERRKLASQNSNSSLLIDHSNDQLIKDAYKCLSKALITHNKGKITIVIPTKNYPELQGYIKNKIDNYLIDWLEINYPNRHWNKADLQSKTIFGWNYLIKEK
ncbi:hypothetical protein [Limosilactobacillus vaginalis]|uniref:hypothetical protein n=1 Tax=Limosilactobacillus vaginalis TaxID=1633 RepID=UPI0025A4762F|nr:hypothetical protein [Limosilactobacillus vaginalis]MDM8244837.1 hypothetical protein [Limosilactobacillus vaginalis]